MGNYYNYDDDCHNYSYNYYNKLLLLLPSQLVLLILLKLFFFIFYFYEDMSVRVYVGMCLYSLFLNFFEFCFVTKMIDFDQIGPPFLKKRKPNFFFNSFFIKKGKNQKRTM